MSKKIIAVVLGIVLVLSAAGFFVNRAAEKSSQITAEHLRLSQEEVADLVKPAVVRIVQHVKGKAIIEPFGIDFKDLTIKSLPDEDPLEIPVDEYITGSGFIINPDGYILTNSHVVSEDSIKISLAGQVAYLVMISTVDEMSEDEMSQLEGSEADGAEFGKRILKFVRDNSEFDLTYELTVLSPVTQGQTLAELIESGFPAETLSVNNDFFFDGKDAALIKIEQSGLPSVSLSASQTVSTGQKIYVFGFPATAEFNERNLNESTFTQGAISAIKDSDSKQFKIYQTDAKISQGSSGGPLVSEDGKVVGIVTYQTDEFSRQDGDNFAFAIPASLAGEVLKSQGVADISGAYQEHLLKGLAYRHNSRCARAQNEFDLALKVNPEFSVARYVTPHKVYCSELIASGKSVDTRWQEIRHISRSVNPVIWILLGGVIIFSIIAAVAGSMMYRRLQRDEREIGVLERDLNASHHQASAGPVEHASQADVAQPDKLSADPVLAEYVAAARGAGLADSAIRQELTAAGWPAEEIDRGLTG